MRTDDPTRRLRHGRHSWRATAVASGLALAVTLGAHVASGQAPEASEQARVPTSFANVHEAPGSGSALLLLVPRDTVLPIIGRRGEWVQVQLSPDLRKTGMVIRWYEGRREIIRRGRRITIGDEDSGWMHDSTVAIEPVATP